ncbi:unnamed protein product [Durusdinium trenchii]|uniref:Uncharacterized protein n=1 Tax=Durusdinium trenchii TaxID=1381693 RepID=A0ABP0K6X7_9DINO
MQFGMRHLTDRKEFLDQYSSASMQKHPCGEAPEAMLRMRLEKLSECQQISEEILGLLQATVSHLLCAACRGGVESNAALLIDAEVALSDEWKRLSVATQKVYQEIRAHDAAIAGQMRKVGADACIMDFVEAQRRGIPAPGTLGLLRRVDAEPFGKFDVGANCLSVQRPRDRKQEAKSG